MSNVVDIFLEPGKVFTALKDKPTFWVPLLISVVLVIAMTLMYFNKVDGDWFTDHQLTASGKEMSASEMAQAKAMMPSARTMGFIGATAGSVVLLIMMSVVALYYMLAGKITGMSLSFRHGLSLTSWSAMPNALGMIVAIVGVLMMTPQTALESLMLTNLDPLLVQLPPDHAWSSFAKQFSLLSFWSIYLGALGWRTWGKTRWGQAITVAAIPSVLIYGGMALYALMKS